jgi:hypothetical protein
MSQIAKVWTTSIAAAALVALPMIAAAQTYPPAGQSTSGQANPSSQSRSTNENSPQSHLDEATRSLDSISTSDLTGVAMSQVSQIRTQFNDLYNDYKNKSGSASSSTGTSGTMMPPSSSESGIVATDWKAQFNTIESELDRLNIPKSSYAPSTGSGVSGTTGSTSGMTGMEAGSTSANVSLPSQVRDSLTQFRMHLERFYSLTQPKR